MQSPPILERRLRRHNRQHLQYFGWNRLYFRNRLSFLYLWLIWRVLRLIRAVLSGRPMQERLVHSARAFVPTFPAIDQTPRPMAIATLHTRLALDGLRIIDGNK